MLNPKHSCIATLTENHTALTPLTEEQLAVVDGGAWYDYEIPWFSPTVKVIADVICWATNCTDPDQPDSIPYPGYKPPASGSA